MSMFRKTIPSILLLFISEVLLIFLFPGSTIIESTITAGGDTPSHFISAIAMSRGTLSIFSPVTWIHGAFAGFPLFLHYFPLPFALMALISKGVSLQVAFKLVTLLAVIPLPAAVYLCLRRLGYRQNTPAIGAVLSLPFLLMTENSMWGGNICSTLSGEFAFGISFMLYIIFTGKLYADISARRSPWGNSALEAFIAMSSGYPLLQSVMGTSYFILRGRNLRYILQLHAAAAGLAAFWLLPALWRIPWNTPFALCWHFEKWAEIAPPLLWPSFAGTLMVAVSGIRNLLGPGRKLSAVFNESNDCPELYLFWQFGIALLGFSMASSLGLVDVRFLPFAQIMLVLLGAIGWGRLLSRLPRPSLWLAVFSAGVVAIALTRVATVDSWIQWNYSGMESKPLWNSYRLVNEYLSGDENSPRVVFEHNELTNGAGSPRAFELLPYYSGRSTLEGLYMQSSPDSPFVFYIQSELSQTPSTPLSRYYYSRPNPNRAAAHLRLFNVSQVIAVSDDIDNALDSSPDYELGITFPPFRIYRLKSYVDSYVEPLRFRPLRIRPQDWKKVQFEWFRKSTLRVPLVVAPEDSTDDFRKGLQNYEGDPEHIPEVPIPGYETMRAQAVLGDGKITIDTSKPGHPLWIKVSYHPDWRISEGAGELYLASPAFMLLVPQTSRVVLTFDTGAGIYLWGKILFFLTVMVFILKTLPLRAMRLPGFSNRRPGGILYEFAFKMHPKRWVSSRLAGLYQSYKSIGLSLVGWVERSVTHRIKLPLPTRIRTNARFFAAFALMAAIILVAIFTRNHRDPALLYGLAAGKFQRANDGKSGPGKPVSRDSVDPARLDLELLDECIEKFGHSSVLDYCVLYKASLMSASKRWTDLRLMLEEFLEKNPDSRIYAEGLILMGEASLRMGRTEDAKRFFRQALFSWPQSDATKQAGLRLAEMIGADALLETAKGLLASGRYLEAYNICGALALSPDTKIRDESVLCLAHCSFYMNRSEEASNLFLQWLKDNFEAPESAQVQADLRTCQAIIAQNREWLAGPASPARSGLLVRVLNWAGRGLRRQ
ncbi:MAG: 6-pyruvoyl-tetrahydropterin synthase-related protein [Syntrophobacteraceae bacterium]